MLVKEFRVLLPITVEEYQIAQLWSVAEASKNETGGGEGIEVVVNKPFDNEKLGTSGQYTYKVYHLESRVPKLLRAFAPKGSLELHEEAWNAYPHCKTVIKNPGYMKNDFEVSIETMHMPDFGETENAHNLAADKLAEREVIYIDIANDPIGSSDYSEDADPLKFVSCVEGRGALTVDWINKIRSEVKIIQERRPNGDCSKQAMGPPHMCAYKLVSCNFKWFGFQGRVERFIQKQERRLFTNFHRQLFCWMNKWHGLTMDDIRRIEDETKAELDEMRKHGSIRGTKVGEIEK